MFGMSSPSLFHRLRTSRSYALIIVSLAGFLYLNVYQRPLPSPSPSVESKPTGVTTQGPWRVTAATPANKFVLSPALHSKFHQFFENNQTLAFKKQHITQCFPGRPKFGAIVHGKDDQHGFGSLLDVALNPYMVAVQPEINRTFQLLYYPELPRDYTPFNQLFIDFAKNSSCPIYPKTSAQDLAHLKTNGMNFSLAFNNNTGKVDLAAPKEIAQIFSPEHIQLVCDVTLAIRTARGSSATDQPKAQFLQALWNPRPELKQLIATLWSHLATDTSGGYFGVHMRRGDKIKSHEMRKIPQYNYSRGVLEWCSKLGESCPRNVFVASDDPMMVRSLRAKLGEGFMVFGLKELLELSGLTGNDYIVPLEGKSPHVIEGMTVEKWDRHTREVVVTLSLLAMSDNLLCTYSSNWCRLAGLLRLGRTANEAIRSLDRQHIYLC